MRALALIALFAAACARAPAPAAGPRPTRAPAAPAATMPAAPGLADIAIAPWPEPPPVARVAAAPSPPPDHSHRLQVIDAETTILRRILSSPSAPDRLGSVLRLCGLLLERAGLEPDAAGPLHAEVVQTLTAVAQAPALAADPRMDEVLATLGTALMPNDPAQARSVLVRLIKGYPASPHVASAYLAFGEYYFAQGDLEPARKFYDKVTRFPGSEVAAYAGYKMAWVDLNLGEHARALAGFVRVIRLGARDPQKHGSLVREALRDAARAYAHVGRHDRAEAFFRRLDAGRAEDHVAALAGIYRDMGKLEPALSLWTTLAERHRAHPARCTWSSERARTARELGRRADASTAVADALAADAGDPTCAAAARVLGRAMARSWHADYQRTRAPADADGARDMYRAILAARPGGRDAALDRLYLAHLAWHDAAEETAPARAVEAWRRVAGGLAMAADELGDDNHAAAARRDATTALNHARAIRDAFGVDAALGEAPVPLDLADASR